ncbi:hybrid sensor histidine kinase/response regulator transcription factor [Robiginitalea sp. IMCC43444]|uniref:hybrid sensor histidine kinase/response regulator transcription factor n=1 Tax=Robiginitalea sp. IMCC43444 TaxID=3459121 RepID=UPI0040422EFE
MGRYKEAYAALDRAFQLQDSLSRKQKVDVTLELESKYQTEKKEQEIALLNTEKELVEQQKTNQRNLLLGGIGITSMIGIFLFVQYRNRKRTNDKLRELDRLKSNFFANISHEFRTPLTLIMGPVEQRLSSENISPEDRQDLEMIDRNSRRLLNLVDQLLDLSRLESGKYQIRAVEGDLGRTIRTQAEGFQYLASRRNIEFEITVEDLEKAWFDRDVIEKVMANLLSNALKYTNSGGGVSLRASRNGNKAVLSVRNTALTLDPKNLEKLFERFYQADSHTEGAGIGLSLVRELVQACHGSVQIKALDESTFQIIAEFPVAKEAFKAEEIADRSAEGAVAPVRKATIDPGPGDAFEEFTEIDERPIILVAEDNTDVRQLLRNNFSKEYKVIEAGDGKRGTEIALERVPDLIISDIMMPEVDGLTLCQTLKSDERTSHIPIILLTARAGEEDQYKGLSTGADAYVTKPFKIKTLNTRVSHLIDSRKALRERYSQEVILRPKDIAITSLDELFLERVQKVLDNRLTESSFSIQEFSEAVAMSRMQLHRKLKALTGLSASEFVRSQRLKLAADLLRKSDANVSHIGYEVGFNDPSYFAKCFKEAYGVSPTEFSKKSS